MVRGVKPREEIIDILGCKFLWENAHHTLRTAAPLSNNNRACIVQRRKRRREEEEEDEEEEDE
jgi:hypothetical protein